MMIDYQYCTVYTNKLEIPTIIDSAVLKKVKTI